MTTPASEFTPPAALPANKPPRLSVQAFWLTASKVIAALLNIAFPILLVRLFNQTDYGVYKQTFLFAGTVVSISMLGVSTSAFYFMPRYPERGGQIALNILIYNLVVGWIPLLLLILYPQILSRLFRTDALLSLAIPIGVLTFLQLSSGLSQLLPTALQDVKYSTIFIIGTQLAKMVALGTAAIWFRTIESLIIAQIFTQTLAFGALLYYLDWKFPRFWAHFDWAFFKEQLAYALPYGALGVMWTVQRDLDNYFVGAISGPAVYAIYSIGWLTLPFVPLFLESIGAVMVVRISALHQQGRTEEIRRLTAAAINRLAAFQFPVYAFLAVAAHDLVVLMYTQAYEKATVILEITILTLPIQAFLVDPIVRSFKELRKPALAVRCLSLLILFTTLAPVIRRFGMTGAASLAIGLRIEESIFMGWRASRSIGATARDLPLFADLARVTAVTAISAIAALLLRNLLSPHLIVARIAVVGVTMCAIYLPAAHVLHFPGAEMLSKDRVLGMLTGIMKGKQPAGA